MNMNYPIKVVNYPTKNSLDNIFSNSNTSLNKVLEVLQNRDYSKNSLRAMMFDLKQFSIWYKNVYGEKLDIQRVTTRDIQCFRDDAQKADKAVSTINRRLVTLKQFFSIAEEVGIIDKNPAHKVKSLSKQSLAPKSLTQKEARKFLKEVELRKNLRDRVMIELMLGAGLRVSEVVSLKVGNIELSERKGVVHIKHSKANKSRKVPLHKNIRILLEQYLKNVDTSKALFIGQRGMITSPTLNKIVDKYASKAGIKVTPHLLRHTFAYNYLNEHTGDIVGLAQLLGHSNINTTAIYTQNRLEDLQEKVENISY